MGYQPGGSLILASLHRSQFLLSKASAFLWKFQLRVEKRHIRWATDAMAGTPLPARPFVSLPLAPFLQGNSLPCESSQITTLENDRQR